MSKGVPQCWQMLVGVENGVKACLFRIFFQILKSHRNVNIKFLERMNSMNRTRIFYNGGHYIWWPKYANVGLDLVRLSKRLFPKFGRNTSISYATRLEKKFNVQQNAEHWFFVFESDTAWLSCWSILNSDSSQRRQRNLLCWIQKYHHFWCDLALLFFTISWNFPLLLIVMALAWPMLYILKW